MAMLCIFLALFKKVFTTTTIYIYIYDTYGLKIRGTTLEAVALI